MKKPFLLTVFLIISIPSFAQTYTVERVIDGNTIVVTDGKESMEVDLIGIETPNIRVNNKALRHSESVGQEATLFLNTQIHHSNGRVVLDYDVKKKDKSGRLLAYVFLNEEENHFDDDRLTAHYDGKLHLFLNAYLIKHGYAKPVVTVPNVKYTELFNRLHQEAFEKRKGIYKDWKNGVPDGTYYEYFKNGDIRIEARYKDNKLIQTKAYDENGNIISQQTY